MRANFYIIGAGGVGSWICPALCKLVEPADVVVLDGDAFEEKNLDRQLFDKESLGENKAEALSGKYQCAALPMWFGVGVLDLLPEDWLLVCADNHPARYDALQEADRTACRVIIAANETHSAEAYFYQREWKGTKLDPRIYYPTIETSHADDPRARSAGCTGEAQTSNRQLVTANFMAGALLMHLLTLWHLEVPKLDKDVLDCLPFQYKANLTSLEVFRIKQFKTNNQERTETV
jgi:molybdopterin/thiamine biosynthesis adenylyltransferase